jgi:endonuclease YncB( thermonuclease family)
MALLIPAEGFAEVASSSGSNAVMEEEAQEPVQVAEVETSTETLTPTSSSTATIPPTFALTYTLTPTLTQTFTPTSTSTATFTPTFTRTYTPTITLTSTITNTPTITLTPTITITPTITLTPTRTNTPTRTYTPTRTNTPTKTPTPTVTIKATGDSCIPQGTKREVAYVTRVIDGDTIEVNIDGKIFKVRYIGIDAPEFTPNKKYYGAEAAYKNRSLVEGRVVALVKDVSETDRFESLLRYVLVGNIFVNDELVRQGFAWASNYPPDVACKNAFAALQKTAAQSDIGFWAPTSTPKPTLAPQTSGGGTGGCDCSRDYNCSDFATHNQAQACFVQCGGSPSYNWSRLDRDGNGLACESN